MYLFIFVFMDLCIYAFMHLCIYVFLYLCIQYIYLYICKSASWGNPIAWLANKGNWPVADLADPPRKL